MNTAYALVDCNNFYASCERVFNPKLRNKPIVVLSNNDGCVISRSNEAKSLGIPMGAPAFKFRDIFEKHDVHVFSTNFTLYGDMSHRVMSILKEFSPNIEIYSVDEAFLTLDDIPVKSLTVYCRLIHDTILHWTGIPVSIGIGTTKTLAKAGSELGKKNPSLRGVCNTMFETDNKLAQLHVSDVWGVGRQYSSLLLRHNITTALALKNTSDTWIRRHMTIQGLRTIFELRGTPCIEIEEAATAKKTILTSRTFGKETKEYNELAEAIASFTARACEKLRGQHSVAWHIMVFTQTNPHKEIPQYRNAYTITLPEPSNYTPIFISAALQGLRKIYRKQFTYKRAGVILTGISHDNTIQLNLFSQIDAPLISHERQRVLMKIVDHLNHTWGRNTLTYAITGTKKPWHMRQLKRSLRFTTRWEDLLQVTA